ncbi:MAG: energy transducer TonB, partial [Rhodocyclales bacterium]|nr:energy transducer TonB [Rhodocyclales bacterium]
MRILRHKYLWALLLSVAVHAGIVGYVRLDNRAHTQKTEPEPPKAQVVYLELPPPVAKPPKTPKQPDQPLPTANTPQPIIEPLPATAPSNTITERPPARMEAPPAPSAEEWALAGTYTLKNSKRYRYNWGQQVRSMMGTAIEGHDQGVVRFRIEIAPDGSIVSVQTLWTTSETAEKLAREAIAKMP